METKRFDAAEFLNTPEAQAEYITAALEGGDPAEVRDAIGTVARARGMAEIASAAQLNPKSLYRALGEDGNPEFATVLRVLGALGIELSAAPKPTRRLPKRKRATSRKAAA
jgi:probable addiction module antidote protein